MLGSNKLADADVKPSTPPAIALNTEMASPSVTAGSSLETKTEKLEPEKGAGGDAIEPKKSILETVADSAPSIPKFIPSRKPLEKPTEPAPVTNQEDPFAKAIVEFTEAEVARVANNRRPMRPLIQRSIFPIQRLLLSQFDCLKNPVRNLLGPSRILISKPLLGMTL